MKGKMLLLSISYNSGYWKVGSGGSLTGTARTARIHPAGEKPAQPRAWELVVACVSIPVGHLHTGWEDSAH